MPVGKVKWFDPKKGYGFIVGDEGQDVFVHYTSIQGDGFRALKDGETVAYELVEGEKGYQARNVNRDVESPAEHSDSFSDTPSGSSG
ncbi:MAG: cold-shock protein [Phycisphaerae bacterium]